MIRVMFSMLVLGALASAAVASDRLHPNRANDCDCKVCQPVSEVKKVPVRVYTSVCDDFCLLRPSFLGGLFCNQDCAGCKDARCGPVHTKKFLVVKIRTHEECVTKCVPKPVCEPVPVVTLIPAAPPVAPALPHRP